VFFLQDTQNVWKVSKNMQRYFLKIKVWSIYFYCLLLGTLITNLQSIIWFTIKSKYLLFVSSTINISKVLFLWPPLCVGTLKKQVLVRLLLPTDWCPFGCCCHCSCCSRKLVSIGSECTHMPGGWCPFQGCSRTKGPHPHTPTHTQAAAQTNKKINHCILMRAKCIRLN